MASSQNTTTADPAVMAAAREHMKQQAIQNPDAAHRAFDSYPWARDSIFQSQLAAALLSGTQLSPAETALECRRKRYTERLGIEIDAEKYQKYRSEADRPRVEVVPQVILEQEALYEPDESKRMYAAIASSNFTESTDANVPSWQRSAPKAALYVDKRIAGATAGEDGDKEPYPKKFEEIIAFLQTGQELPGIVKIPDTVIEDPDHADMRTARVLLQVSQEVRSTILNGRQVFHFQPSTDSMACVYGQRRQAREKRRPAWRALRYSNLFVDWERDLFYFPRHLENERFLLGSGKRMPRDNVRHLLQDTRFRENARNIAIMGKLSCTIPYRRYNPECLESCASQYFKEQNQQLITTYAQLLPVLRSVRLVTPAKDFPMAHFSSHDPSSYWSDWMSIKQHQYGFSDPADGFALCCNASLAQGYAAICHGTQEALEHAVNDGMMYDQAGHKYNRDSQ